MECLEQAIALDPEYAQPHAELGLAYLLMVTLGHRPLREVVDLIRDEARKALELDPSDPGPRFLLGALAASYDYDWKEAGEHFRAALAAPSVGPYMHWAYASFPAALGPFRGVRRRNAARGRSRPTERVPSRGVLSAHLNQAERYDRAIENAHQAIEIDENHWMPYFMLSETYANSGRFAEAIAPAERAHRAAPWNTLSTGVLAGALVGEKSRAEELVRQMGHTASDLGPRRVPPAVLGDRCGRRLVRENDRGA